jgi:hypothetical protein
MIQKSTSISEDQLFQSCVLDWFDRISKGEWDNAFSMIDLPPESGVPYSPQRYRDEIENDHFAEGTVFRKQHSEGIIYSSPHEVGGDGNCEIYDPSEDNVYEFECDVPLNGEWSDLTSGWQFIDNGDFYAVRLEWLHVL